MSSKGQLRFTFSTKHVSRLHLLPGPHPSSAVTRAQTHQAGLSPHTPPAQALSGPESGGRRTQPSPPGGFGERSCFPVWIPPAAACGPPSGLPCGVDRRPSSSGGGRQCTLCHKPLSEKKLFRQGSKLWDHSSPGWAAWWGVSLGGSPRSPPSSQSFLWVRLKQIKTDRASGLPAVSLPGSAP